MTDIDPARRERMIESVRGYFEACNTASRTKFAEVLAEDCVHWFPPETGGPYRGRDAIADLWIGFVHEKGSRWTIDRVACDGLQMVVEWTHFKPKVAERIRGSEWYEFAEDGRITGIWAHYASPRDPDRAANELEGFDYAGRGYPVEAPELSPAEQRTRARSLEAD